MEIFKLIIFLFRPSSFKGQYENVISKFIWASFWPSPELMFFSYFLSLPELIRVSSDDESIGGPQELSKGLALGWVAIPYRGPCRL